MWNSLSWETRPTSISAAYRLTMYLFWFEVIDSLFVVHFELRFFSVTTEKTLNDLPTLGTPQLRQGVGPPVRITKFTACGFSACLDQQSPNRLCTKTLTAWHNQNLPFHWDACYSCCQSSPMVFLLSCICQKNQVRSLLKWQNVEAAG